MARKKKSQQKKLPKEFSNSPFKSLKGLSAFESKDTSVGKVSQAAKETGLPDRESEDENSFAGEMDFLGVRPLNGCSAEAEEERLAEEESSGKPAVKSDRAEFLEALGSLEKVFKDEWTEEDCGTRAVPGRMKQVEKGQLKPQAELDLHGLTQEEARGKVLFFLQNSIHRGFDAVLIITGKGLHSDNGPVLRRAIEKTLDDLSSLVVEWGTAPKRYGGSGALVVFLRHKQ